MMKPIEQFLIGFAVLFCFGVITGMIQHIIRSIDFSRNDLRIYAVRLIILLRWNADAVDNDCNDGDDDAIDEVQMGISNTKWK